MNEVNTNIVLFIILVELLICMVECVRKPVVYVDCVQCFNGINFIFCETVTFISA
jgi:hypothetical protein